MDLADFLLGKSRRYDGNRMTAHGLENYEIGGYSSQRGCKGDQKGGEGWILFTV